MKRLFLYMTLLFLSISVYSQSNYRFTLGLSANDYTMYGYGAKFGYRFGPGVEFRKDNSWLSYGFDFFITTKGTSGSEGSMEQKYFQIPVNLNAHMPLSEKIELVWANSIYLAYAFDGISISRDRVTSPFSDDNLWGLKIPRFDMGISTGLAVDFGRCALGLHFEIGLYPLDSDTYYDDYGDEQTDFSVNGSVFLSLAVKFWK